MGKRKKSSFDDGSDDGRKRRKYDLSEQLQEVMDALRNYKTTGGKVICETFIRAPKRRSLAEYYEVVSQPIDILRIQQKIRMDEYDDLDQFTRDIELLVNNAKSYYKPDSTEYADAAKLWEVFEESRENVFGDEAGGSGGSKTTTQTTAAAAMAIDEDDFDQDEATSNSILEADGTLPDSVSNSESESANGADDSELEELFSAVMTATSDDGRQLSSMFELLPSKSAYPDYYEVVTEPIDLKTIASKIQQNEYAGLNDLERDIALLTKNAKTYNAPGSQIYKDANTLKRIFQTRKSEVELRRVQPGGKTSSRIRAKRQNPFQPKWSAITASLKYEEEDDEQQQLDQMNQGGDDESGTNEDTLNYSDSEETKSNPQWLLLTTVKDTPHSEPFIRLPSKRHYPDYYKEIKRPISLSQISKKIKTNCYENIAVLMDDLTLVFDNAMAYNRPDSKIYKDAEKLKKILQVKSNEIINVFKDEGDDEDDDDKAKVVARSAGSRATRKSSKSMVNAMSQELKNVRRSQKAVDSELKKRMRVLYKTLLDYSEDGDRFLVDPFMDKPSKKLYPDYYAIIQTPIDMKTIESKIKNDAYETEAALLSDFRLMFNNCRQYNEDGSQIYRDADKLEALLSQKHRELGPLPSVVEKPRRERVRPSSGTQLKIKTLFETVRDYTDQKGRLLSAIFQKLPSRAEFPDYYETIRQPISLEKIGTCVKNCIYETVDDLLSDIILMLDNATKYNEPDSQIFKDALTLQQVALRIKIDLNEDSVNGIPDVKIIIQDLLTNLFISVYNHQDEEGRCFSDSINELTELGDKNSEVELRTLNFDLIKRNLNRGRYRRMDRFQQDMFEVFERARRMSRTDSQAFEDSIELQQFFIAQRDELCRGGAVLQTAALDYTQDMLKQHIETLRREKVPKEINEEDVIKTDSSGLVGSAGPANQASMVQSMVDPISGASAPMMLDNDETMVVFQDVVYKVGDFVYVAAADKNLEPHIVYIEKFKRDPTSDQAIIYGCWFYRPHETFHIPTRRFLEKEVFKTDSYTSRPVNQVLGKCCVMFVKQYFHSRPMDFQDCDVYVCESRYSCKGKSFKKIKNWGYELNVPIVMRDVPLEMNRVPSVFKNQATAQSGNAASGSGAMEDDLLLEQLAGGDDDAASSGGSGSPSGSKILDVPRPNVMAANTPEDVASVDGPGCVYYDQFSIPAGTFRVGDCCYVRTDQERNLICRIDRMWVDGEGNPYFHGPWYVQQAELPPNTIGSFYPQEVFLSSIEDTNPLLSICERCSVLDVNDYILKRPTEFLEKDVYVCEIRYLEHEKRFEPLPEEGLLKVANNQNTAVVRDEWYFFRKALVLQKDSYQLPHVLEETMQQQQQMFASAQMVDGQLMVHSTRPSIDLDSTLNDESNLSSISASTHAQHHQLPGIGGGVSVGGLLSQSLVHHPAGVGAHHLTIDQTTGAPTIGASLAAQLHLPPGTPSVVNVATPNVVATPIPTPVPTSAAKPKPKTPKRLVTGYIIFASEVRKSVVEANPECSFGDISRIIGSQWKLLGPEAKADFEKKAMKQNAEMKEANAAEAALQLQFGPPPDTLAASTEVINGVFECHWEQKCDYQFEDVNDLFDHLTAEPHGHVWVTYAETKDKEPGEFQCKFHGCGRVKKGAPPFPNVPRLVRHCKEVHINKAVAKVVDPEKRSRNYVPSSKKPHPPPAPATPAQPNQQQQQQMVLQAQQQQQVVQQQPQTFIQQQQQVKIVNGQPTLVSTGGGGQIQLNHPGLQVHQTTAGGQQGIQVTQGQNGTPTQLQLQAQPGQTMQAINPQTGQIQTIQIAGPGGHPNTIQVMTSQPTAFLQQGQTLVGHTATIGGQTIKIQQPTAVVFSLPQQMHFAAQPSGGTVAGAPGAQAVTQIQLPKPQQTMCYPPSSSMQQQQQSQGQQQSALQQQLQMPSSGGGGGGGGQFGDTNANPISTLHPTLAQAIQSGPMQHQMQQHQPHGFIDGGQGVQVKPSEPLFMAPPKTNRLAHTHTYMKYIESLKPDRRYISNWERQLSSTAPNGTTNGGGVTTGKKSTINGVNATAATTNTTNNNADLKLNGWMANSALPNGKNGGAGDSQESVVNALWSLRNFMMKDALDLASL